MWKLYKIQLLIMSPLLILSLIVIVPIYYIYKLADMVLFNKECVNQVLQQTCKIILPCKVSLSFWSKTNIS